MQSNRHTICFTAGTQHVEIFRYKVSGGAIDITGATFEAKVRKTKAVGSTELLDFSGNIVVTNGTAGELTLTFANADTSAWEADGLRGIYEIAINMGSVRKVLIGPSDFILDHRVSA
jgi:hypothetical protein